MPPPPGPNAPSTVQVSQYAHLASTEVRNSFNRDEIRQLVLEYLISGCYVDSAQAFASEVDMLDQSVDEGIHRTKDASSSRVGAANGHESVSEMTNGRHRGNGTEVPTSSGLYPDVHAMEGVEGTPEPEITPRRQDNPSAPMNELEGDDAQSVKGGATFNGAGKKVMFESIRDDSLEEDRETSLLSLRRLKKARQRRHIQEDILSGRIQSAIDSIQRHFPHLLGDHPHRDMRTPTPAQPRLSLRPEQKCRPDDFFKPTQASGSNEGSSDGAPSNLANPPILGATFGQWSLSLEPSMIWLNLRLQSFVELMRTAHATASSPSTPTRMSDSMLSTDSGSGAGMSASTSSLSSMSASVMNTAITQSQALRAEVYALPPGPVRQKWERECIDVAGLLAYKDLTTCPVRGYLAQERRDTLAELVNAAILRQEGHTPMPLLSLAAAQCTASWDTLAEWKLPFPPNTAASGNGAQGNGNKSAKKSANKTYPAFQLSSFLRTQDMDEVRSETNGARPVA